MCVLAVVVNDIHMLIETVVRFDIEFFKMYPEVF